MNLSLYAELPMLVKPHCRVFAVSRKLRCQPSQDRRRIQRHAIFNADDCTSLASLR
jgi:hypothetical protein